MIQTVPLDVGSPITHVSLADPYICVRVGSGQVITLALRETKGIPRLAVNKNTISSVRFVIFINMIFFCYFLNY